MSFKNCLSETIGFCSIKESTVDEFLQKVADSIHQSFDEENTPSVLIEFKNKKYYSAYFNQSQFYTSQPIKNEENIIGEICLYYKKKVELTPNDKTVLANISSLINIFTSQKEYEQKIAENEKHSLTLLEFLPLAAWIRVNEKIVYMNRKGIELLGLTNKDEIINSSNFDFVHPDDACVIKERMETLYNEKTVPSLYERFIKKNGELIHAEVSASAYKYLGQDAFLVLARDITEKKEIEKALKVSEHRYKDLADSLPQNIFETDEKGNITFVNKSGLSVFGYSEEELTEGLLVFNMIVPEDRERAFSQFNKVMNGEVIHGSEYKALKKDGTTFPSLVYTVPINPSEKIKGLRGILIDISDEKKAIEEIIKAKEKSEEANRLRSAFLSTMSHEIRTPLHSILGLSEFIRDAFYENADEETKGFFDLLMESSQRLLRTITSILDYSRIISNSFDVTISAFSLNLILESLYNKIYPRAQKKGLELKVIIPPKNIMLLADDYCCKHALLNVIDNAIKYSSKGKIEVSVSEEEDMIRIKIKDEGIGMTEQYQEFLFEAFSQEDVRLNRKYEGTGLGLALTKNFIELVNGKIEIESEKNIGTTVHLYIPAAKGMSDSKN